VLCCGLKYVLFYEQSDVSTVTTMIGSSPYIVPSPHALKCSSHLTLMFKWCLMLLLPLTADAKAFGVDGYGAKASEKLMTVRGKDFRHEKTKKKRGSYRGGSITMDSNSFKYD
jgi:SRP40, C-terminal domain